MSWEYKNFLLPDTEIWSNRFVKVSIDKRRITTKAMLTNFTEKLIEYYPTLSQDEKVNFLSLLTSDDERNVKIAMAQLYVHPRRITEENEKLLTELFTEYVRNCVDTYNRHMFLLRVKSVFPFISRPYINTSSFIIETLKFHFDGYNIPLAIGVIDETKLVNYMNQEYYKTFCYYGIKDGLVCHTQSLEYRSFNRPYREYIRDVEICLKQLEEQTEGLTFHATFK
jgi:hypothetical protein